MSDLSNNVGSAPLSAAFRALLPAMTTVLFFSFFINLLLFVSPLYMLQIYDRAIPSRSEATLVGLTLLAAYLLLVYAGLEAVRQRIMTRAGLEFDRRIAEPVFLAVHRSNMLRGDAQGGQALRDVDTLREFATGAGAIILCDAPWIPIFLAACFVLHPYFGYLAIGGAVLIVLLTLLQEVLTTRHLANASRASGRANGYAVSALRNGDAIQAMGMLGAIRRLWSARHAEVLVSSVRASDRAGMIGSAAKFVRMFLQTMILGVGAYLAINGQITPGTMIAASIIIGRALAPVEGLVGNWKGLTSARGALARLRHLMAIAALEERRVDLPRPTGRLELENVVAGAPGQTKASLRGVGLRLDAGKVLGVIGPSAAGKSSLARVICGVWKPAAGTVRLDGAELAHWDPQKLGPHIGYLPQDVELFSGTVAENIARFQEAADSTIVDIARLAGCHDMIQNLPNGYNTQIGEGGTMLSGGQKQRIGLARAFFGLPALVVLDEPNASLDLEGMKALLNAIERFRGVGTTIIVITHAPSVLAAVDDIVVMVDGQIQSRGARDEMLMRMASSPVALAA